MQFLSMDLAIKFHRQLIDRFGGLHGIHDKKMLDSALEHPKLLFAIAQENDKHILAASYAYHLIHNHPFIDGNKRIGILSMIFFLKINKVIIRPSSNDLYALSMKIALKQIDEYQIASILKKM